LFVSSPNGLAHVPRASLRTAAQYSKCPISSAKEMLPVWAALKLRVAGVAVLYMGWKSCSRTVHFEAFGAKTTDPNPFAALAVMLPVLLVVRS
jgi:hypothetical protein